MSSIQEDVSSHFKLAQLWHVSKYGEKTSGELDALERIVNEILKNDLNINYKVNIDTNDPKANVHLKNCTALHFVYSASLGINIFNKVLNRGADFTLKNENGQTALHMIIESQFGGGVKSKFIKSVLSAQVETKNFSNPRDNGGISHLHGACITNHVESLKLFLDNGASVDEAINHDAEKFAGYTPLHFAVKYHNFEAAEMLLNYGANVDIINAEGMTALDLTMEYRMIHLKYLSRPSVEIEVNEKLFRMKSNPGNLSGNEKMIKLLLENQCHSGIGLSNLQVACTLKDLTILDRLLDQLVDIDYAVPMQSSICPGYTALHFAAKNDIHVFKKLLTQGAKIDIEDDNGLTTLDICCGNYSIQDIYDALSSARIFDEIYLSDGETKLLYFVKATTDMDEFELFLQDNDINLYIPHDSILWPGYTILHLAVIFSTCKSITESGGRRKYDESLVKKCLDYGSSVNMQNVQGQTPIHLAFRLNKTNILLLLLVDFLGSEEVVDYIDENNLSYLHIACAMNIDLLVEELLKTCDANIVYEGDKTLKEYFVPGITPLHLAVYNKSHTIAKMLLDNGANLNATDQTGLTPIHWLFRYFWAENDNPVVSLLFSSLLDNLKEYNQVIDTDGLSYLHVACYLDQMKVVERLLDLGSNVNTTVDHKKFSHSIGEGSMFSTCTPLHLSQIHKNEEVMKMLILYGADLFTQGSVDMGRLCRSNMLENKTMLCKFMSVLWDRDDMQKDMEERLGLTELHIACYIKNEEKIKTALEEEVNVNAQMLANSKLFAGCTALHLLVIASNEEARAIGPMIKLLLDHGANVMISNVDKDTVIHMFDKHQRKILDGDHCKNLLFNAQQDFKVNPMDAEGLSHFHLACLWHKVKFVNKYLQHGSVDVNQPVDCFAKINAGCNPLHLALKNKMSKANDDWKKLSQTVDLLLKYGANVNAKDVYEETALHKPAVLRSPGMSILDKLVKHGADVKIKNIRGQTLFDRYSLSTGIDLTSVLLKYNYPINSWNNLTGEGYIAKILSQERDVTLSVAFEKLTEPSVARTVDEFGRTALHNSIAILSDSKGYIENYICAIEAFIKQGVDLDSTDTLGQTALHYAARMGNIPGLRALLKFGADINIIDNNGKSAFSYAIDKSITFITKPACIFLNLHAKRLNYLKLEVNQINRNLLYNVKTLVRNEEDPVDEWTFLKTEEQDSDDIFQSFYSQLEISKTVEVGVKSFTLFDFLQETGAVTLYPYLPISERIGIDKFFISSDYEEFNELIGVIKLQYRKMKKRLELIESANNSVRILLGFSVPGLCEEIMRFLTNSELENLITSTSVNSRKRKRSETIANKHFNN